MAENRIDQIKLHLEANPEDAFLNYALAMEYWKIGELETAQEVFESLRSLHPSYVGLYYQLGRLYMERKDRDAAIACLRVGLEVAKEANDRKTYQEIDMLIEDLEDL